jgi:hypothetical protein
MLGYHVVCSNFRLGVGVVLAPRWEGRSGLDNMRVPRVVLLATSTAHPPTHTVPSNTDLP